MGYEVDFLAVGEGSKSGDAIALRYGNLYGDRSEQTVVVIDGGFSDSGTQLVEHIKKYYETDHVDLVISTHPDQDHVSGLTAVLESLTVGEIWMHLPWNHEEQVPARMFQESAGGRIILTKAMPESLGNLERSFQGASNLYDLANSKGIPVVEPFSGLTTDDGSLTVIGPTQEYYEDLMAEIERAAEGEESMLRKAMGEVAIILREAVGLIAETFHIETLANSGETSPQNSSSAIILFRHNDRQILFTADAGIEALTQAADYADLNGISLLDCKAIQVPHHGSKRNVGPTILDRIIGPPLDTPTVKKNAVVSCSVAGEPKHPAKKVLNAFRRRGAPVVCTRGRTILSHHDSPDRGWVAIEPEELYNEVEE